MKKITTASTHSWPIIHQYHRCVSCGYIIESRSECELRFGKPYKQLSCPRCQKHQLFEPK